MLKRTEGYQSALSIDLRVFNNQLPDFGVGNFLERLGFVPDYLFNHETYVGKIHSHDGKPDDTLLLPTWTAQRGIPGGQSWTRRQYKGLVDALHRQGVKFFQGAEAAWSRWPEYDEASRDNWIYEHLSELFVTYRNGVTTRDEMGMLCPLKRLQNGEWYEDLLLRDVLRFLNDYGMDGFFAADGFGGLGCKLYDGDYSDDMVDQFTQMTGIQVRGTSIPVRAEEIWTHHRSEWACFYADRWADFYRKLVPAIKAAGKEIIVMAPFKHGPAESLMEYGFDYAKNAAAGLDFLALESMETSSRRWQYTQAMEAIGISNVTTIKAIAPQTRVFWMSSTCNCPEHWHTLRDIPNALERECLALNTARTIGPDGRLVKGFDGVQPLFSIDLNAQEWRWYRERLDIGHMKIAFNGGLVLLWSNDILYEHARRGESYPLSTQVVKLRFSGLPIHTAADISALRFIRNRSLLLIDPLGIRDSEVQALRESVEKQGKNLIVVGNVENDALLRLLGLEKAGTSSHQWRLEGSSIDLDGIPETEGELREELGGYRVGEAVPILSAPNGGSVSLSVRQLGKGNCIYIRRLVKALPPMRYRRSEMDWVAHPNLRGPEENDLLTTKQVFESLANVHPNSYELICARCVRMLDGTFPYSDKGQVLSCADEDGNMYIFCENPLNMLYLVMTVTLPANKKYLEELTIRSKGPVGYQYYGDIRPKKFDVCIPPEALIPFRIVYDEGEIGTTSP